MSRRVNRFRARRRHPHPATTPFLWALLDLGRTSAPRTLSGLQPPPPAPSGRRARIPRAACTTSRSRF
jgi:hypothetical protein